MRACGPRLAGTLFRRLFRMGRIVRRIDQRRVRKRSGKVPEQAFLARVAAQRALEMDALREQVRAAAASDWALFHAAKERSSNANL
jgi:hypothetical protein